MANEFIVRKGLTAIGSTTNPQIKLVSQSPLATPVDGSMEYDDGTSFPTFTTLSARYNIALNLIAQLASADQICYDQTTQVSILSVVLAPDTMYKIEIFCNITATNTTTGMIGYLNLSQTPANISIHSILYNGATIQASTRTQGTSFASSEFSAGITNGAYHMTGSIHTGLGSGAHTLTFYGVCNGTSIPLGTTSFKRGGYMIATPVYHTTGA